MSPKHFDRYMDESAGRHNLRSADTPDQMRTIARRILGQRLRYRDLIARTAGRQAHGDDNL